VLSSTVASNYYDCCTEGSTIPEIVADSSMYMGSKLGSRVTLNTPTVRIILFGIITVVVVMITAFERCPVA
jgi:hypothetical protein